MWSSTWTPQKATNLGQQHILLENCSLSYFLGKICFLTYLGSVSLLGHCYLLDLFRPVNTVNENISSRILFFFQTSHLKEVFFHSTRKLKPEEKVIVILMVIGYMYLGHATSMICSHLLSVVQ